ncbi:SDR family NAD(P)-dependent oxidoreductase [Promicromonospora iranensis]|uniref:NAD(P)-dependent dehydrogenase (Short-subunit alcohol dehydrogenase family) n=1 Tax=Promicromonospora iranensis TaxID=1105144 RepID=A0ABU2CJ23_9MICO|nr:SDR family oxidoreductase [Promicromonospora iranensis]MDR7381335.1 NAD(P)-dependent dehydrogenase (short-subunit alcohol dehydrogenase family) [Promicromonospora iranensis]
MAEPHQAAGAGATPPARTALVTGASRGIGREVALGLARAGLDVALLARDAGRLAAVATEVRAAGVTVVELTADVTDPAAVRAAVGQAEEALGSIDLLVNNAGAIESEHPLWEADPDEWWSVFETNVRAPFLFSRYAVPGMIERGGGRVIDLASGASSHEMAGGYSAYNASKTALVRMGANLHGDGFRHGIRVFELAPGVVKTDMSTGMSLHEGRTDWTPVERVTDVVNAVAAGELDACSGWFLRVSDDTPESLRALAAGAAEQGSAATARRLRVLPAGGGDPLADTLTRR